MKETFAQVVNEFKKEIMKYFPDIAEELELVVAIHTSLNIKEISQPVAIFLMGPPASGKTTTLELIKPLNDVIWRDNFTPAALVSGVKDMDPEEMLLYQLNEHTLVVPEFAPLSQNQNAKQIMADLTRLCDSNGLIRQTGFGDIGFSKHMRFNLIFATVRFDEKSYTLMSTMGPRLLTIRFTKKKQSFADISKRLVKISQERPYSEKLEIGCKIVQTFMNKISKIYPNGISINSKMDDSSTVQTIADYSQLLAMLRGLVIKQGREFTSEVIKEDPQRCFTTLITIARSLSFIRGRSFISPQELSMIKRIVFDSADPNRVNILKNLLKNGSISTSKFVKDSGLSRATVYRRFHELVLLGLCNFTKKPTKSKPESCIILDEKWKFLEER